LGDGLQWGLGIHHQEVQMPETPTTRREAIAAFRLSIVGDLLVRDLARGELTVELKRRAELRYRAPGSETTRTFHWKTLQSWLRQARRGVGQLQPASRERGHAGALDVAQQQVLLDMRKAHPTASVELLRSEAIRHGLLQTGSVSLSTLRRLFRAHDLSRASLNRTARRSNRRRWQAARVGDLWHADVCHVSTSTSTGKARTWRVHAVLDDCSRYITALEVHPTETEADLLRVLCIALLRHPRPKVFFVDNGSCYRGEVLAGATQRLGVRLVHAKPYDPEARGKMERLWRTMRQQCTDHITRPIETAGELANVLWAWVESYHDRPHGGLMGARPKTIYHAQAEGSPTSADVLAKALEITEKRRVSKAATLSLDGRLYETQGHLAGRTLTIRRCGLTGKVLGATHEDRPVPIGPCDPTANARRGRAMSQSQPEVDSNLPFHPIDGLLLQAREARHD
jgi:putative transposase